MQKIVRYFLIFLFVQSVVYADIYEIYDIESISRSVNATTLVLFDIDDTLIHTETAFGSHKWEDFIKGTFKGKRDKDHVPMMWYTMRNVPFIPVESTLPSLLDSFQKKGVCVMGLTARHPISVSPVKNENLTTFQLKKVKIFLGHDLKSQMFGIDESVEDGVIFCKGAPKGQFLVDLFGRIGFYPAKVVFVDDKYYHAASVDNAMRELEIPCDCYWYQRIEQKRSTIDPWVALTQFEHFIQNGEILSDKEAKKRVENQLNNGFAPEEYLLNLMEFYDPLSSLKLAM